METNGNLLYYLFKHIVEWKYPQYYMHNTKIIAVKLASNRNSVIKILEQHYSSRSYLFYQGLITIQNMKVMPTVELFVIQKN